MAVISYKEEFSTIRFGHGVKVVKWEEITENDTCQVYEDGAGSDKSVHVNGSFGGGSVSLLGSNDGSNFPILKDLDGSAITMSSEGLVTVRENVRYYKPGTPGGTGVSVSVYMLTKVVR